jgi:hypothetical protein
MRLTNLTAAPVLRAEVPPCARAGRTDGGTASQLIRSVRRQTLGSGMITPTDDLSTTRPRTRWVRITAVFLALSYGLGAPAAAFLEVQRHLLSERFHYSPVLIYLVCAVQVVCAITVLVRRLAPWAAGALTITTLGAVASHIRINSPMTAIPAILYTAVQVWFGLESREPPSAA